MACHASMRSMRRIGLGLWLAVTGPAVEAQPTRPAPMMPCNVGPISKQYAGVAWLVYSGGDDQSLVVVSSPGSPAMPFYFFFGSKDGKRTLNGEGTGNKAITDAAFAALKKLTERDIAALIAETRQAAGH